jgi:hypothetical protein
MRGMYQPCLLTSREDVDIHGLPWSAQVGLMTIGAPDYSGSRTEDTVSCFKVNTWVTWLTWHCIRCKVEMAWFDHLQFDEIMETQCFMGGKTMLYHVIRCYKCPNFWAGCSCRNLHHGHLRILDLIVYSIKNRGAHSIWAYQQLFTGMFPWTNSLQHALHHWKHWSLSWMWY